MRLNYAVAVLATLLGLARMPAHAQTAPTTAVLLRLDDAGMNASVNAAIDRIAATGMPVSVSVLFVAPRWREAVEILRKYPHVSVGVHLALNSEWRDLRWGPVLGASAAPSLVDSSGNLRPSRDAFLASSYDPGEVEREIDAQVARAMHSGLRITYVDAHMGMLEATPELRVILERVARKHGLAVARRYNESYFTLWGTPVHAKQSALLAHLATAKRDTVNLVVVHPAEMSAEMERLFDLNAPVQNTAGEGVAAHRAAELTAVLSDEVRQRLTSRSIRLVTYGDIVAPAGRRPPGP